MPYEIKRQPTTDCLTSTPFDKEPIDQDYSHLATFCKCLIVYLATHNLIQRTTAYNLMNHWGVTHA